MSLLLLSCLPTYIRNRSFVNPKIRLWKLSFLINCLANNKIFNLVIVEWREQISEVLLYFHWTVFSNILKLPPVPRGFCSANTPGPASMTRLLSRWVWLQFFASCLHFTFSKASLPNQNGAEARFWVSASLIRQNKTHQICTAGLPNASQDSTFQ